MNDGQVGLARNGGIAHVLFDRPEARNAMTWSMYQRLEELLTELAVDDGLRAVTFRGAGGKAFIAGTDIRQFQGFDSADDGVEYERFIEDVIGKVEELPVPTLAIVEGYAVGGGLAIAAACDLRICTSDARFGLPIARTVGNCLSMENYARLVSLLGVSRAKAMLLLGSMIPAHEAARAGFVVDVVDPEELDQTIQDLCDKLLAHAPITMRVTKEAIRRIVDGTVPEGSDLVQSAYGSRDFKEGVNAFLAKRKPVWKGT